ncbi:hypothetical protein [Mesorhizobium shangrilense]|uniref:Uncharacterized protein n=1 Tax=Mesorhizobium shangrilense TaxID=460060 RepID=A0ABV2DFQ8_9HYPH
MVRLQPDLLQVLDDFAREIAETRPEAMRIVFSQWAESAGFIASHHRLREPPAMVFLSTEIRRAAIEATGQSDVDDAVNAILRDWLSDKGYKLGR